MTFVSRYLPYWYLFFPAPIYLFLKSLFIDVFCGGGAVDLKYYFHI